MAPSPIKPVPYKRGITVKFSSIYGEFSFLLHLFLLLYLFLLSHKLLPQYYSSLAVIQVKVVSS